MKKLLSRVSIASFLALVILLVTTLALPCVPAQAATTPECWGVFVGVSTYQYMTYLSYVADEAQSLAGKLSPTWGSSHVRVLTDSQATRSGILSAIHWLADNAKADDTVLFSFSGRGGSNSRLCPYDAVYSSYSTYISSSELADAFQSVNAQKSVIILMTYQAGEYENYLSDNGRVIMMSCRSDETCYTDTTLGHFPFNYYILQAFDKFDTVDTNDDYELSAEEIFEYAGPLTTQRDIDIDSPTISHPVLDDRYTGELPLLAKFAFATNTNLPSGTNILTLDGVNYTSAPSPQLWIPGSTHTMTVPEVVNAGSGTRYVFTGWNDGNTATTRTVSRGSFTPNYDKQYQLSVDSAYGTPAGAGWYKEGLTATFSVTPSIELTDTKHYFTGWSGDFSGTTASASLVMNAPKTVTANWRHEYLLSVDSAYGTPAGAGWYKEGLTATFSVTPSIELTDTKHYFTGWSGDFSGTTASASLIMSGPKKVTANWRHEYLLKINSEYGQPTGAGWYKEGERANISVEPTQGFIIRHIFTGWSGDLSDTQSSIGVSMTSPKVITATWQTDFIQLYILIGIVVVLAGAIVTTVVIVRGRGATPPAPPAGTPPQYTPPPAPPPAPPPPSP